MPPTPRSRLKRPKSSTTVNNKKRTSKEPDLEIVPHITFDVNKGNSRLAISERLNGYQPHSKCSNLCLDFDEEFLEWSKLKDLNPFTIPTIYGWRRRLSADMSRVFYLSPCQKRIFDMDGIAKFLSESASELTVELFSFNLSFIISRSQPLIHCHYLLKDLSNGVEPFTNISVVNEIDHRTVEPFSYLNGLNLSSGVREIDAGNSKLKKTDCCSCVDNCADSSKCECRQLNRTSIQGDDLRVKIVNHGYDHRRLEKRSEEPIFECNHKCSCNSKCPNRLAQLGVRVRLQMFKTQSKGWGVRSLDDVPSGQFVCVYAGEVLTKDETRQIDFTYFVSMSSRNEDFTVDANKIGNVAKFLNHSCKPNCFGQNVFVDSRDRRFPWIAFFTKRPIAAMEELTWNYGYGFKKDREAYGVKCDCGETNSCRGQLL